MERTSAYNYNIDKDKKEMVVHLDEFKAAIRTTSAEGRDEEEAIQRRSEVFRMREASEKDENVESDAGQDTSNSSNSSDSRNSNSNSSSSSSSLPTTAVK